MTVKELVTKKGLLKGKELKTCSISGDDGARYSRREAIAGGGMTLSI
jgi:hypothetical protein